MPRQTLKQRADGRYVCKYRGQSFYGYTQREALEAREEFKRMQEAGIRLESIGETVKSYAYRWLPVHKVGIRNGTYNAYAHYIDVLCDVLGDRLIRDITPTDIKSAYNQFLGASESTIKKVASLYRSMFDSAVADGLCRSNPCKSDRAKPHKGEKGTHRAITEEERRLILTTEHRMRPAAMTMLYAGLRRGEAMGLNIDRDVDLSTMELSVRGAVHIDSNQPIYEEHAKTESGLRTIPIFKPLADALTGLHGLLMPSANGKLCSYNAFKRGWDSYLLALSKTAGKPISIRAHDLRHSYCTMLRDAGVDLKIAVKWMGHADEKMILRIYDHITPEREQKALKMVETELASSQIGSQI